MKATFKALLCYAIIVILSFQAFAETDSEFSDSTPRLMVTDYKVIGIVYPGSAFSLELEITNKSSEKNVKNIKITYASIDDGIISAEVDSSYIEAIPGNTSVTTIKRFRVKDNYPGGYSGISVSISYEDDNDIQYSSSDTLTVYVPKKIESTENSNEKPILMLSDYSIEGEAVQGGRIILNLILENKSSNESVKNIKVRLTDESGAFSPEKALSVFIDIIPVNSSYTWSVPLKIDMKHGGRCLLTVSSEYENSAGEQFTSSDTAVIVLPETDSNKAETTVNSSEPKLMVTDYRVEDGFVLPDESKVLTITVKNTHNHKQISNIKFSIADETGEIKPDGTGTLYVPVINPGNSFSWKTTVKASHTAKVGEHAITFSATYEDQNKTSYSSSDIIRLDVKQSADLSYSGAVLPVKVIQGESASVSINLMNTGKSVLSNCTVSFEIENLQSGGDILVGDISPGETKVASGNLRADSDTTGNSKGIITISYEDEYGSCYSIPVDVSTVIQEKVAVTDLEEKDESNKNPFWWVFILVGFVFGGGLAAGIITMVYSAKKRKKDEEML